MNISVEDRLILENVIISHYYHTFNTNTNFEQVLCF